VTSAVEAVPPDLVVLVTTSDDGNTISLTDYPVVGWRVGEPGTASVPVITGTLTEPWVQAVVTRPLPDQLGGAIVAVFGPDGFRGTFAEFLDHLVATTGLGISGTALADSALVHGFERWVAASL
jgi:hypothetical protein